MRTLFADGKELDVSFLSGGGRRRIRSHGVKKEKRKKKRYLIGEERALTRPGRTTQASRGGAVNKQFMDDSAGLVM